jgi:AraC family transcriptional regulator
VPVTRLLESASGLRVVDYRCAAGPADTPFTEVFDGFSLSYVARGSFGCTTRGRHFELVAGSLLVGRAGDEYRCIHEHHDGGDECLSFRWSGSALDAIEVDGRAWRSGALPAVAPLAFLGALGRIRAAAQGDCGLEEIALLLANRFSRLASAGAAPRLGRLALRDRRRAVEAALFIAAHSNEPLRLERIATLTSLSPFHFLRLFARVTGFTPHQYLVRVRLLRAAELLADPDRRIGDIAFEVGFGDLSNFVRTFHRATGMSPGCFRRLSRPERKICQDAWQAAN